jgi:hypothetical protein
MVATASALVALRLALGSPKGLTGTAVRCATRLTSVSQGRCDQASLHIGACGARRTSECLGRGKPLMSLQAPPVHRLRRRPRDVVTPQGTIAAGA